VQSMFLCIFQGHFFSLRLGKSIPNLITQRLNEVSPPLPLSDFQEYLSL
jgi:hypothetical protein